VEVVLRRMMNKWTLKKSKGESEKEASRDSWMTMTMSTKISLTCGSKGLRKNKVEIIVKNNTKPKTDQ
jgi:hypothetical protein